MVCSSALVEDLFRALKKEPPSQRILILLGRAAVLAVALIAMLMALNPNDTILGLVSFAWAGFGASFGPIILLSLYWRKLTVPGALAGMISGAITVFMWSALDTPLYELLPAFLVHLVVSVIVSLATYKENPEIQQEFTASEDMVHSFK